MSLPEQEAVRLDKWLWAARFFKTRGLAAEAVNGGKVHVNGHRTKPGKELKIGDELTISKEQYTWTITIVGLNNQRRPAKEAVLLYEEHPDSIHKRHAQIELQKQQQALMPHSERERRPDKKQRRQIHRFKQSAT
jgi:ribosome-associated heat shock protein Hsp15